MTEKDSAISPKWAGLVFAIQFLTIVPITTPHRFNAGRALPFFPICGLFIGLALVCTDAIATRLWPTPFAAVAVIVVLAVISGALHLDGLADTADGLYGNRNPDQALAIMKDSRVGAMGLVAVVCCLAVKLAAVAHLSSHSSLWLLLVPAYARAAVLFGTRMLPYGRSQDGIAHNFFQTPLVLADFWGLAPLLALSLIMGWQSVALNLGFALLIAVILAWYHRRMGFVTGDMMGAMIEITEAGLFSIAAMKWGG